jgi:hypothetical protein
MASIYSSRPPGGFRLDGGPDPGSTSLMEDCTALVAHTMRWTWRTCGQSVGVSLRNFCMQRARNLRRELAPRRLFSLPHILVAFWLLLLLWGERWVFATRVQRCRWDQWENWVGCRGFFGPRHGTRVLTLRAHCSQQAQLLTMPSSLPTPSSSTRILTQGGLGRSPR